MKAVVIIPTYNEAQNIGIILDILFLKVFPKIDNWSCEVLVIDDNSHDNTGGIITKKMKDYKNLYLLSQPKKCGIGKAYLKGFRYAMDKLSADIVIEFDGDFQHPPDIIPKLLDKIEDGYDCVLGSRFISGGDFNHDYSKIRKLLSQWGGFIVRFVLFFPSKNFFIVTDPTSGLRATRIKNCLEKIDLDYLLSKGFGYKVQLLNKIIFINSRYTEIPLVFGSRFSGSSKFTLLTIIELAYVLVRLKIFN